MVVELGDGVMAASVVAGGMVSAQLSLPLGMGEVDGAIQRALRARRSLARHLFSKIFGGRGTGLRFLPGANPARSLDIAANIDFHTKTPFSRFNNKSAVPGYFLSVLARGTANPVFFDVLFSIPYFLLIITMDF